MITGKTNYEALSKGGEVDFVSHLELLRVGLDIVNPLAGCGLHTD